MQPRGREAGQLPQDLHHLHAALAVADHHRPQALAFVVPGDHAGNLLAAFVTTERIGAISGVGDASPGIPHAHEKLGKRDQQEVHRIDAAVDVDDSRRRSLRQHSADVRFRHMLRIQGHDLMLDLRRGRKLPSHRSEFDLARALRVETEAHIAGTAGTQQHAAQQKDWQCAGPHGWAGAPTGSKKTAFMCTISDAPKIVDFILGSPPHYG